MQLGLICQPASQRASLQIEPPQLTHCDEEIVAFDTEVERVVIPFVEADVHKNIWVDGPPPPSYFPGLKKCDSLKQLANAPQGIFAGWISFDEPISTITIYGPMSGIKCSYSDSQLSDRSFGDTSSKVGKHTQIFADGGERITAVTLQDLNSSVGIDHSSNSLRNLKAGQPLYQATKDANRYLVKFLTNKNMEVDPSNVEVVSEHLAGVQFFFSATCIIGWDPLLDVSSTTCVRQPKGRPPNNVALYWDPSHKASSGPHIFNPSLIRKYRHSIETFGFHNPVDGVLGFTAPNGRFCGLLLRRNGVWNDTPLGRASQSRKEFPLQSNEQLVSITISKMKCADIVVGVAV